jgi:hypothetical protein
MYAKANEPMDCYCESVSKETDESVSHSQQHERPRNSTLRGIKIDSSDDDNNASESIRINCEFDSNEIDGSDSQ